MTDAGDQQEQTGGLLAVLWALVAQIMGLVQGGLRGRALARQLVAYEVQLALALFGGGLAADPGHQALTPEQRRAQRRALVLDFLALRNVRRLAQRIATARGRGYRRSPFSICTIRFERRIASRRTRRLGCARLRGVASTREPLAGAPP